MAATESDANVAISEVIMCDYKHCKQVIVKRKMTCIKCYWVFYPGCFSRAKTSQDCDHKCMLEEGDAQDTDYLKKENQMLRCLIQEMDSKNCILQENVSLLHEKISSLEEKLDTYKQTESNNFCHENKTSTKQISNNTQTKAP